jgi:predicted GTPase
MGYGDEQIRELVETIRRTPADLVVIGTPVDLTRLADLGKPSVRVRYELQELGEPTLMDLMQRFVTSLAQPAVPAAQPVLTA